MLKQLQKCLSSFVLFVIEIPSWPCRWCNLICNLYHVRFKAINMLAALSVKSDYAIFTSNYNHTSVQSALVATIDLVTDYLNIRKHSMNNVKINDKHLLNLQFYIIICCDVLYWRNNQIKPKPVVITSNYYLG